MAFTGDLEHLPIVDVIQLLHATRKSGILRVKCRKGESQLVFKDGYMVSANHLNNSVRIGKILSDLNLVSPETLDQALQEQIRAGQNRKPLIITLLEKGAVKEEDAYKGLERLIEMTIVEILTWKKGTFALDVLPQGVVDDHRFYPEKMGREINIDTQSVLMDALRIYDEKMRDGELHEEEIEDDNAALGGLAEEDDGLPGLSADDLGLADFDRIEMKIPVVFKSLDEEDPCKIHSRKIQEMAPELSPAARQQLSSFLASPASAGDGEPGRLSQPLIFFTSDELVGYSLAAVCKHAGIPVFATDETRDADPIIAQSLSRNTLPILVFDAPQVFSDIDAVFSLRQLTTGRYPSMVTIQLAASSDTVFSLQSYCDGVSAVFPRPMRQDDEETFIAELIDFLQAFQSHLRERVRKQECPLVQNLATSVKLLRNLTGLPEIATAILQFVGGTFPRAVTLVVRESEVVVEKSIGVTGEKNREVRPAIGLKIPLSKPSLFWSVIEEGCTFYGSSHDDAIVKHLFPAIGAPGHSTILLLPMLSRGRTVAITYADFGDEPAAPVDIQALEIIASQAELVLENSLFRKKFLKSSPPNL